MIRLIRYTGYLLVVAGIALLLIWSITPLRFVWPWIRGLPLAIKVGVGAAAIGLLVLLASMIGERIEEREKDRSLKEDY